MSALETAEGLLTGLFGVGGVGLLIKAAIDKRKSPLERTQVLADAADTNVNSALAIAARAAEDAAAARAMASEANTRSSLMEAEVLRLRSALNALRDWAYYVVRNWDELRQHPTPPALPPEAEHTPHR